MTIDHIFIFSDDKGTVADELIAFGLTEGSSRVHVGQGTTNRKFYFDNFFLEILWVHNEKEIISEQTKSTGLWKRANYRINNFVPFGLCLVYSEDSEKLFEAAYQYQPDYFPDGMAIDIIKNESQPNLPWTFQLPFKGQKKHKNEPNNHSNGIRVLSKAVFEYQNCTNNNFLQNFKHTDSIQFEKSSRNWLNLIFDDRKQGKIAEFKKLNLTIEY